ncbi:MAG: hypothetical protein IKC22_06690 [Bacilli bacterium]|nr:hypothetical protein [Bacilli bacterium]
MFLSNKIDLPVLITLIIIGMFILALLGVGILKLIQIIRKQIKRNKRASNKKVDSSASVEIFGGLDNIIETQRQLNRILVKVVNKKLVNFEVLKEMNVGTQITGNIIKCSSSELADSLENIKK